MRKAILVGLVVGSLMMLLTPTRTDASVGQCNSIIARALGSINQIERGIDVANNCDLLAAGQLNFIASGCVDLLNDDKLFINHILINGASCNLFGALCDAIAACGAIPAPQCLDGSVASCS